MVSGTEAIAGRATGVGAGERVWRPTGHSPKSPGRGGPGQGRAATGGETPTGEQQGATGDAGRQELPIRRRARGGGGQDGASGRTKRGRGEVVGFRGGGGAREAGGHGAGVELRCEDGE